MVADDLQVDLMKRLAQFQGQVICSKLLSEIKAEAERALGPYRTQVAVRDVVVEFLVVPNCFVIDFQGWKKFLLGYPDVVKRECYENNWPVELAVSICVTVEKGCTELSDSSALDPLQLTRLAGDTKTDGLKL